MKLLTSQKNILFDTIKNESLSPSQFELEELNYSSGLCNTNIKFKGSEYFFLFGTKNETYDVMYSPASSSFSGQNYTGSWDLSLSRFSEWIVYLKRETQIQDKWAAFEEEINNVSINFSDDQNNFSAREYEDLKVNMLVLKQGIANLNMLPDQVLTINAKLDYLCEIAVDMNKFDWNSLFLGTIISVIIQLSVTQDNAKAIWTLIKQAFNNYFLPM